MNTSVKQATLAAVCGAVFGIGLVVSGMTDANRVIGFLDLLSGWDPTLAFVMGGAILVHAPATMLIKKRSTPWLAPTFSWPSLRDVDAKLLSGAALFGIGWGLSGYCPGPALVSVASGGKVIVVFAVTLIVTVGLTRFVLRAATSSPNK